MTATAERAATVPPAPDIDLDALFRLYRARLGQQQRPTDYTWHEAIQVDGRHALGNRLPGLTQLRRRVLHLRYYEGLPLPLVARLLQISQEFAAALDRLAVAELRRYLTGVAK